MAIGLTIKHSTGEITTGTGNLTLNAAGNLVLDYATFPASDGTAGFVLSTDGAGNLSWIADDDTPAGYNNTNWDTAYGYGNHASAGYLTSQTTHADVVQDGDFSSTGLMKRDTAGVYSIITDNSNDWNYVATNSGKHTLLTDLTGTTAQWNNAWTDLNANSAGWKSVRPAGQLIASRPSG